MSANPKQDPQHANFSRMVVDDIDQVLEIEYDIYPFPWTRGNFLDSIQSGYDVWVVRNDAGDVIAYFLLMMLVDDAHLLNITVKRDYQGLGLGKLMLDRVAEIGRNKGMTSILLEVRPSNAHAFEIYQRYGYHMIGRRKGYYPAPDNTREDALIMRQML